MSHPQELLDYWADSEAWSKSHDPEDWPVSRDTASKFQRHLERLNPVATAGNDLAKYAMASIYLLELTYPDDATREKCSSQDRAKMTQLLCECAENGMGVAFDNLVTSGTGEIGDSARAAAKDYEISQKPDWDVPSNMPVYTPNWMEGAMNLWRNRRGEQGAAGQPATPP
jgi:hypothetical protein